MGGGGGGGVIVFPVTKKYAILSKISKQTVCDEKKRREKYAVLFIYSEQAVLTLL